MEISNKKIVVTGAASGIGKELVKFLSRYDCVIFAVDRNGVQLSAFIDKLTDSKANIFASVCDVGELNQVDELFALVLEKMNSIDIFIANAGFAYYEQLSEPDWDRIDQIFKVNVYSPIYSAIKMKSIHPDSAFKTVITASAIGKLGLPGYALYGATKSAVDRFAEAYRFELADPTYLSIVYPISTRTQFFKAAADHQAPIPWPSQTPGQVARSIIRGIEKDQKSIYPSRMYQVFLILGRIIPPIFQLEQRIENQRFKRWIKGKTKD